jgi:hypothetical protein
MKFGLGSDSNMYAALHGSWNRQPPSVSTYFICKHLGSGTDLTRRAIQGYKVVYTPGSISASGEWSPTGDMPGTKNTWKELLGNRNEGSCNTGNVSSTACPSPGPSLTCFHLRRLLPSCRAGLQPHWRESLCIQRHHRRGLHVEA